MSRSTGSIDPSVRRPHIPLAHALLPVSLLLLFLPVMLAGCGAHPEEHAGHEQGRYPATAPLLTDTVVQREYVCQIHSAQHIELRALEEGYLQDVLIDEGQHVKEGQLMFRIQPVLYQAEVEKAEAEVEFCAIEYNNTKVLADSNVVSPNELAMARAKLSKARAKLSMARAHLGFTEVHAPFDGIMGRLHVRRGSMVDEGDLLTELSDNSAMWVYFNVPEAEYIAYRKNALAGHGTQVRLKMADHAFFGEQGEITAIESDFDNRTGNIAFRATFPNPQGLLRHGQTGTILMGAALKDVLLVPQKATFAVLDHRYMYVIDKDSVVHSTRVEAGPELQHLFVIDKGLRRDDRILLEGLRKVKDGEKVDFTFVPPDSVVQHLDLYAE